MVAAMSDDAARDAAERERLHGYIARSLRLRRRLSQVLLPVAAVAVGLVFVDRTIGLITLVITLATLGVGTYITTAHVADWRARLALQGRGPATAARARRR
jgi:hypothetical protein